MLAKKSFKADLEHQRGFFMEIGLFIALATAIVAFEWNFKERANQTDYSSKNVVEDITELIPITEEQPKRQELVVPTITSDIIKIVPNNLSVDNTVVLPNADDFTTPVDLPTPTSLRRDEAVVVEDEPFVVVEEMPTYMNGGLDNFQKYVLKNVVYSEAAKESGIYGTVIVEFVVGKLGRIEDVKVLRGVDPILDNEVVRVIRSSKEWKPGYQRGNPVRVKFTLPVKFTLQ